MGTDKAFVDVGGRPLVTVVAGALREAGAAEVLAVGGDEARLAALGLRAVPDDHPGEGPLGGIVTALRRAQAGIVVVLACDLPWASAAAVRAVVRAVEGADVAVAAGEGGRPEPLHAAWRRAACLPALEAAFAAGERAPARALAALVVRRVAVPDAGSLRDADRPEDVPGGGR
jgi:molybdopterin-guanine dinucleotide biosynthesis protein A